MTKLANKDELEVFLQKFAEMQSINIPAVAREVGLTLQQIQTALRRSSWFRDKMTEAFAEFRFSLAESTLKNLRAGKGGAKAEQQLAKFLTVDWIIGDGNSAKKRPEGKGEEDEDILSRFGLPSSNKG